jgi:hypothetical protein
MLKKAVSIALLSTFSFASTSALRATNAHAFVVGLTGVAGPGSIPLIIAGALAGNIGSGLSGSSSSGEAGVGIMIMITGLVLDAETQTLTFEPVTGRLAHVRGISQESAEIYNDNIEEFDAIAESVAMELAQVKNPTLEKAKELWDKYLKVVHPKVSAAFREVLAKSVYRK